MGSDPIGDLSDAVFDFDNEIVGSNNHELPAIVWGMGDEMEDEMSDLEAMGYHLVGEKPPENWQAGIPKQV